MGFRTSDPQRNVMGQNFYYSSLFTFQIAILMHTDSVGTIFSFCLIVLMFSH